ncbi:hypothetical protein WJX73_005397 [Symbiochloris irregularis]|uniref:HECT-type E3 ubiquitin transferase n=1 Tax=Symbiochloris irregularis TaxID=706552 RepID=A0AAW1NZK1_9CHLO
MGNCLTTSAGKGHTVSLDYEDSFTTGNGFGPVVEEPQIYDAVSERLPAAAQQGSRCVVDLIGGPGYLDVEVWTSNLDIPVIKARATALENGVDALLVPLLKGTEQQVVQTLHLTWDQLEIDGLLACMAAAARDTVPLEIVAEAVHRLLGLLLAISKAADANKLPAPAEVFQVNSINHLARMVSLITTREIQISSRERAMARWAQWRQLTSAIGLVEEGMALALNATSRALLIFLQAPAKAGSSHCTMQVNREHTFLQSCQAAQAQSLLEGAGGACLIFPSFACQSRPGEYERESGQGPRREFFRLAGQSMLTEQQAEADGEGLPGQTLPPLFVLKPSANKLWFNTRLVDTPRLKEAYAYAGWLVAQQLSNCASINIQLPELVFEKLLEGDRFKASIERLQEFDAAAAGALRTVASAGQMSDTDFRELLEVEGCPATMSRATYVQRAVHHHLVGAIEWQSAAFAQGFFKAMPQTTLEHWRVTPADLAELSRGGTLNPTSNFGFRRTFRLCVQPEVPVQLASAVMEVLESLPAPSKRAVVAFATGAGRAPPPETQILRLGLAAAPAEHCHPDGILGRLPQARTCDNLLEIPDYHSALLTIHGSNRRLSLTRSGNLLNIFAQRPNTPKSSGKTPKTPRTLSASKAARELDRRLREVLKQRLLYAVEESGGYELSTRHGLGTSNSLSANSTAVTDTSGEVVQADAEDSSLRWAGSAKVPAPAEAVVSPDQGGAGESGARTLSPSLSGGRKRGPSRLATASFPAPAPASAAPADKDAKRTEQARSKLKAGAASQGKGPTNGKSRIGVLADSRQGGEVGTEVGSPELTWGASGSVSGSGTSSLGAYPAPNFTKMNPSHTDKALSMPQPDSPLERDSSIAAVRR